MRYLPMIIIFIPILFFTVRANLASRSIYQRISLISIAVYLIFIDYFCFTPSYLSSANFATLHPVWIGLAPTNSIPFAGGIGADFFLNILMTVPLGIYLGLFAKNTNLKQSLQLGLLTGLTIESAQFIADQVVDLKRWVDINDIITNCLGVIVGYLIFKLVARLLPKLVQTFAVRLN
ncbi:VanZ family protein [Agrilactobacillus yilanensis]|uniref:VanZ family protein n=1 Tax=Agrilactobacillus yilanensis TaxID=2485997 RepID=A0ABW4J7X0_9LACO|nr:VanZ family protein [Agrilactobacillus yilanensis]